MSNKSIIIDFDNTIGYFDQIIYIINIFERVYTQEILDLELFKILDQYPNVFRPYLKDIFDLILFHKDNKNIELFVLYTCNSKSNFVNRIAKYLQIKFKKSIIFDYTIYEKSKTKSLNTLLNETNIDIQDNVLCFIDDKSFDYQNNPNIKYIKCESYIYNYELKDIIYNFPYEEFNKISSMTLKKYFDVIYKKKKKRKSHLPLTAYKINSEYIMFVLNSFINAC